MGELDRNTSTDSFELARCAIVGAGRLGTALARSLAATGVDVEGPLGRGAQPGDVDVVLLCVPDSEIGLAASLIKPGALVGHCSGVSGLDVIGNQEGFSLHPLLAIPAESVVNFRGFGCAIAATSPAALTMVRGLANRLGMHPFTVSEEDRATYHAAASMASNFLVTLASSAERLLATANVDRDFLLPHMHAAIDQWFELGAPRALTGPVVRKDRATVARQRDAVRERCPELLKLFDSLVEATEAVAESQRESLS